MINQKLKIILLLIIGFTLFPFTVSAAKLYLDPVKGEYNQRDTFVVEIKLNTEKENINAVEAYLTFPKDILEVKDLSSGNSVLTLWIKEPKFSNQEGEISFIGGIPGSYSGKEGILVKIIFKVKKINQEETAEVKFLDYSKVLLNDKKGTEADLITEKAFFKILPESLAVIKKEWQEELEKDKIPPEPFKIKISRDTSIFKRKYFIAFSTTDKQTGIDYYEVKEGERDWKMIQSPYILENQFLGERIKVKAVDKAGNERIQMIRPEKTEIGKEINWKNILPWIILIIIGIGIILWTIKKHRYAKK